MLHSVGPVVVGRSAVGGRWVGLVLQVVQVMIVVVEESHCACGWC